MMSAPSSAISLVMYGPGRSRVRSRTRIPSSGNTSAEDLLELERERHIALDLELALHERHLAVQLAGYEIDKVLRHHRDRYAGCIELARLHFATRLGEIDVPIAAAIAREVELIRRVDRL